MINFILIVMFILILYLAGKIALLEKCCIELIKAYKNLLKDLNNKN